MKADLDMGFVTISLVGLDSSGPPSVFVLYYDGHITFDAEALREDGFVAANEWLAQGGFAAGESTPQTVQLVDGAVLLQVGEHSYRNVVPSDLLPRPDGCRYKSLCKFGCLRSLVVTVDRR